MAVEKLITDVLINGFDKQTTSSYLNLLINHRNSRHPSFIREKCHNVSAASNLPMFENSVIEDYTESYDNSLEVKRLRTLEKTLKDENEQLSRSLSITKKMTKVDLEKYEKKTKELKEKCDQNKKGVKEARKLKASFKERSITAELLALELADRIDFPKTLIERVLKVTRDGLCQDQNFCREFSGGKCYTAKH